MMFVSSTSTRQVPLEELELLITELQSSLPDGFVFYLFMVFWGGFFVSFIFYGKGWIHIAQSLFFPLSFGHCIGCPSIYDLFVFFNIS
jgi:hypothetical protein